MWDTILFDLDGTLTASAEGITKSVQYALAKLGMKEENLEELTCFVGPPLLEQFMSYAGLSEEDAIQAVEYYRERYSTIGIFENSPYPGIEDMLFHLKQRGLVLGVASSKPTFFVNKILKHFQIDSYFKIVVGSELDGKRTNKTEVIEEALRQLNIGEKRQQTVMVGDKEHDVFGAKEAGLACIGVAYGYGGRLELESAQASHIVDSVAELEECLLKGQSHFHGEAVSHRGPKPPDIHPFVKIWRCLYPIGIHYLSLLAASLGVGVLVSMIEMWNPSGGGNTLNEMLLHSILYATIAGEIIAIPFLSWCYIRDKKMQRIYHHKIKTDGLTLILTVISLAFFAQVIGTVISLAGLPEIFPQYANEQALIMQDQSIIAQIIGIGILAPIAEELVFRGLVFNRIKQYFSPKWAILFSGLIFGIYHGNMIQFFYATLIGFLLAWVYYKSNSMVISIAGHMAINLFSLLLPMLIESTGLGKISAFYFFVMEIVITAAGLLLLVKRLRRISKY